MIGTFFSIFPVFAMILAGYAAARTGILPAAANRDLNRFVSWIALPALMFSVVATTDWHRLWDGKFALASLAGSLAVFGAGMIVGRLRGLPVADIAVDGLNASYSNAAYIGLPLFLLTMGPRSAPYVIVAATLTLMVLFACAVVLIEFGHHRSRGLASAFGKAGLGVIRNPVILGPLAGLAWWLTGIPLPGPVDRLTRMLGAAASPTALVAIGLFLAERPLRDSLADRFVVLLTAVKLLLHPALTMLLVWPILGLSPYTATLAIAIGALPTGTGPFMVAGFYARDGRVTSGTILLSTLLSVLSLTALLTLLPH